MTGRPSPTRHFQVASFSEATFFSMISSPMVTTAQAASHRRARYLYEYLKTLSAQTVVAESMYTDAAYLDDYAHFYVKSFAEYKRQCLRLHFFSTSFSQGDFENWAIGSGAVEPLQAGYLGFVVIRPLPEAIIGRTVLRTYPPDGGRRHYPVRASYEAHVFGLTLEVESLPFQEQDTVLAACATVALWSAFQQCARRFSTSAPSPAEITAMATTAEVRSRALPSRGLTLGQMCRAIKAIGLEPEVFSCSASTPLNSLLHAYVSWGLPAILLVDVGKQGHAITLAGYSLRAARCLTREDMVPASPDVRRVGLRIDEWYGHDDQVGPFAHVFVKEHADPEDPNAPLIAFEGSWKEATGEYVRLVPKHVIIPVYHKIRVTFLDIQQWITAFNRLAAQVISNFDELEWDVRLTTTNEVKEAMRRQAPSEARNRILLSPAPRFMWRAVLQTPSHPAAELLFDATDMARSYPFVDVLFHDDNFRTNLKGITHHPELDGVLGELVTPQFRDFLRDRTE